MEQDNSTKGHWDVNVCERDLSGDNDSTRHLMLL